jgi:hypothetical protein
MPGGSATSTAEILVQVYWDLSALLRGLYVVAEWQLHVLEVATSGVSQRRYLSGENECTIVPPTMVPL